MLLLVYGSLRRGGKLEDYLKLLRETGYSEKVKVSGLKLYVVGEVPGAVITNDSKDKIVAELIEADLDEESTNRYMDILDLIEGVVDGDKGLYKRDTIDTVRGKAYIYTICGDVEGCVEITDWIEWQKESSEAKEEAIRIAGDRAVIIRG